MTPLVVGPGDLPSMGRPFLTAYWRHLAILSWAVDPGLVAPYVPAGTVLDDWNGRTFLSMVGFLFLDTRLRGIAVPLHRNFEELNLRAYVRRETPRTDGSAELRRGVTFLKELVPRRAIATVARFAYNEPYEARAMRHAIDFEPETDLPRSVEYAWQQRTHPGGWGRIRIEVDGPPAQPAPGSEAAFITEHYWGYTRQVDGGTVEYQVNHAPWRVWNATRLVVDADLATLYGRPIAEALARAPDSALLAEGGEVSVSVPRRLSL